MYGGGGFHWMVSSAVIHHLIEVGIIWVRCSFLPATFALTRILTGPLPPAYTKYRCVYVQHKVRIGTIPELYLRKVRIPALSANSGIVLDSSRIAQEVFY